MAKRTGLTTIRQVAFRMCQLVAFFTPIIEKTYPENTALKAALVAANAACAVLVDEADSQLPVGD